MILLLVELVLDPQVLVIRDTLCCGTVKPSLYECSAATEIRSHTSQCSECIEITSVRVYKNILLPCMGETILVICTALFQYSAIAIY